MSSFTEPLTVTKIAGGVWRVAKGFRYYVGKEDSADFVDVPEGFFTDFASVPRGLWNILPPDGQHTQAAVLHDFLYNQRRIHGRTRKECDRIFLEAMKILGVSWMRRRLMYRGVRIGGWVAWNKK